MNHTSIQQTKVSPNMQTYIPKQIQSVLDIKPQQSISWTVINDVVCVQKANQPIDVIKTSCGIAKKIYQKHGGGQKWLQKERQSWKV